MGTNYYLVNNRPSIDSGLHIGKSSVGWRFLFHKPSLWDVDKPLNTQFTIFPMYYYPRCMTVKRLYFVYNKTFKVGDVYCDTQNRAFYCLGGHIVYCNEDEQFNES